MKSIISKKYMYTALAGIMLAGPSFASNNDFSQAMEQFNRAVAQTREDAPEWATDATNDFMGTLESLVGMLGQLGNGNGDLDAMGATMEGFTSGITDSMKEMEQQAQREADKETSECPELADLHKNVFAAVAAKNMANLVVALEAIKPFSGKFDTANTVLIQNACNQARECEAYDLITCLLLRASDVISRKDYATGLATGFLVSTSQAQDLKCIQAMFQSEIDFTASIGSSLYNACDKCNLELMKVVMNYSEQKRFKEKSFTFSGLMGQLKRFADQRGKEARLYLLRNADRQIGITSFDISDYTKELFRLALETGEVDLLEGCLSREAGGVLPVPDHYAMDGIYSHYIGRANALDFRTIVQNSVVMNVLLNRIEGQARLSSVYVSAIMQRAAEYGLSDVVRSMVDRDARFTRPSQDDIYNAYQQAQLNNHQALVEYLTPLIPAQRANEQVAVLGPIHYNYDVGGYMGVHHYAEAPVQVKGSEHQSVKLLDAVLAAVTKKCDLLKDEDGNPTEDYLNFEAASAELGDWIDTFVPQNERENARTAALFRLASDADYEQVLTMVVNYLKAYHPEKIEVWVAAFIRESIAAYNSPGGISCDRGIRERVAVGLRGVNEELDKLFVQVEGPAIMANNIKKWNPAGEPKEVARHLMEGGLSPEATAEDASALFIQLFLVDVKANGLSMDDYQAVMDLIAEGIRDNYEAIHQAVLEKKESKK